MTSPAASAPAPDPGSPRGIVSRLPPLLGVIGLACLAVITLAYPGSTRMFAWPWSLAYVGALLAPALALLARAFDRHRPLVLPSALWSATACASAATVLLSALMSPYQGPSLLWSAPLLASVAFFFVANDALAGVPDRAPRFRTLLGLGFAAVVLTSLALWLPKVPGKSLEYLSLSRNGYPLGHSNYTAGLAVLALPWLGMLAFRARGPQRLAWSAVAVVAFVVFLSSSSRAGMVGLGAAAFAALLLSPFSLKRKFAVTAALALAGLALVLANPRTRAMLAPADPLAPPNASNVQRVAMLTAATRMGTDRPWLGWGPGTTPLVYPSYRGGLDGGAENVLQLHSTPAQLWAEFGAFGVACALLAAAALLSYFGAASALSPGLPTDGQLFMRAAVSALVGYAVFSLGDWQLDVPVFGFLLACLAASLAAGRAGLHPSSSSRSVRIIGAVTLFVLAVIVLLGHRDPTPQLNVRALDLARDPAHAAEAVTLLRESLALDPHQEISHFNLGWLLLVRDSADAERHFLAALRLVPDKGGVYFGLGLARLNQNRPAAAAHALALECLNEPLFLSSPWWREPALAALRDATAAEFSSLVIRAQTAVPARSWAAVQLVRLAALTPGAPPPSAVDRTYRRERTAYPVLMRNLDLAPPTDLYDVREAAADPAAPALPPKGWLPSPLLLELLDAPTVTRENSASRLDPRK